MLEDPVLAIGDGDVPHGVLPYGRAGRGRRRRTREGTVTIPEAPYDVGNPATWRPRPVALRPRLATGVPVRLSGPVDVCGAAVSDGVGGRARSSRGRDTNRPWPSEGNRLDGPRAHHAGRRHQPVRGASTRHAFAPAPTRTGADLTARRYRLAAVQPVRIAEDAP